jgi:uncharacterized protein (TIGR03118 family)
MNRYWIFALAVTAAGFGCNTGGASTSSASEGTIFGFEDKDGGEGGEAEDGGGGEDGGEGGAKADGGTACQCSDGGADSGLKSGIAAIMTRTVVLTDDKNPNLVNPWGLAFNETAGPAWIANAETGTSLVLDGNNQLLLTVELPALAGSDHASPTGIVFNKSADGFKADAFVFVTEDGTVDGWQRSLGTSAAMRIDNSGAKAIYKGATIAGATGSERLYATDFHNAKIDVFDRNYQPVTLPAGAFVDPTLPSGYAPFNVDSIGNLMLVTYAKQDENAEDDVKGAGNGFVDLYDTGGTLLSRLASNGSLNAPWGIAITPDDFGTIPHRLLIGNFGDGRINVYQIALTQKGLTASFEGQIGASDGTPLAIDGLWSLRFPTGPGFDKSALYFTAGPGEEEHGAYGRLDLRK